MRHHRIYGHAGHRPERVIDSTPDHAARYTGSPDQDEINSNDPGGYAASQAPIV